MGLAGDAPGMPETRAGDDRHTQVRRRCIDGFVHVERRWRVADVEVRARCGWWAGERRTRQASVQERRRVQKEATPGQRRRELRICRWRPEERRVG